MIESHPVKVIVVTGGIASGKSTVVTLLTEIAGKGLIVFDCDRAVKELLDSGELNSMLTEAFGAQVLTPQGAVNKDFLRDIVKNSPSGREQLNSIIHPLIQQKCVAAQQTARESECVHTFIVDIPLFFESKINFHADRICLAAVTPQTQIERLVARDGISRNDAQAMLDAQLPTQEKIEQSATVFWNEGSLDMLREQVLYFFTTELAKEAETVIARSTVININTLRTMPLNELYTIAAEQLKQSLAGMTRREIILEYARVCSRQGNQVYATGVLDFTKDGIILARDDNNSFKHGVDDVQIFPELVHKYNLRPGNKVKLRLAQEQSNKSNRYLRAAEVVEIEGIPAKDFNQFKDFDQLTPLFPRDRIILENASLKLPSMRVLDLITPLGMGQRALIVAPPRGGKTVLLKSMAKSIRTNYPDAELLILLLDERPEEVTDFEETVDTPVYASTFDEPSLRHAQLSDIVLERARRLVEQGKNVIIMLDSLTRLSRGYNANQIGGRIMSGGLGSNALEKPRKFFGAARNVEEGGSLTIIATCLVDTESRMDEIIFEEFKGTGNMEIRLDRELSERRIYPAISIPQSGTRNDDRLYHPDEFTRIQQLRRQLAALPGWEALETLLKNIKRTQNNAELLIGGIK